MNVTIVSDHIQNTTHTSNVRHPNMDNTASTATPITQKRFGSNNTLTLIPKNLQGKKTPSPSTLQGKYASGLPPLLYSWIYSYIGVVMYVQNHTKPIVHRQPLLIPIDRQGPPCIRPPLLIPIDRQGPPCIRLPTVRPAMSQQARRHHHHLLCKVNMHPDYHHCYIHGFILLLGWSCMYRITPNQSCPDYRY